MSLLTQEEIIILFLSVTRSHGEPLGGLTLVTCPLPAPIAVAKTGGRRLCAFPEATWGQGGHDLQSPPRATSDRLGPFPSGKMGADLKNQHSGLHLTL